MKVMNGLAGIIDINSHSKMKATKVEKKKKILKYMTIIMSKRMQVFGVCDPLSRLFPFQKSHKQGGIIEIS